MRRDECYEACLSENNRRLEADSENRLISTVKKSIILHARRHFSVYVERCRRAYSKNKWQSLTGGRYRANISEIAVTHLYGSADTIFYTHVLN